jgi:hypothetical protein
LYSCGFAYGSASGIQPSWMKKKSHQEWTRNRGRVIVG